VSKVGHWENFCCVLEVTLDKHLLRESKKQKRRQPPRCRHHGVTCHRCHGIPRHSRHSLRPPVPPPPHCVNAAASRDASHLTSAPRNREEEEHKYRRREGTEGRCSRREGGARLVEGGEGVSQKGAEGAPPDNARHHTTVKEARATVTTARHSRLALVAVPLQGPNDAGGRTAARFGWRSRPRPSPVRSALEAVP
jgi:hypothetical protein